jgi:hypothetical protein
VSECLPLARLYAQMADAGLFRLKVFVREARLLDF